MLVWRSSDPMLQAHEASGALAGRTVVGISAGILGIGSSQLRPTLWPLHVTHA